MSKSKVLAGLVFYKASPYLTDGCVLAVSSCFFFLCEHTALVSLYVPISSFYRDTNQIGLRPTYQPLLNLVTFKGSISKYSHILGVRDSIYKFCRGHNSAHNTLPSVPPKLMFFPHTKHIHPHPNSPEVLTHCSINFKSQISCKYHLNQVWVRLKKHDSS